MSTLDVELVVTDKDLTDETAAVIQAQKNVTLRDTARQLSLDEFEAHLRTSTPPIDPSQLQNLSEIKDAVKFRTLARLFRLAKTHKDDRFGLLQVDYERDEKAAKNRRFTVSGGQVVSDGLTVALARR